MYEQQVQEDILFFMFYAAVAMLSLTASTTFCGCCCFINEQASSYQGLRVSVGPAPFSAFIRTDATMLESKTVYL